MPTIITHAASALALTAWFYRRDVPKSVWIAGSIAAAAPDLDAIGFWAGVPYDSMLGHRGLTHSVIAAVVGAAVLNWMFSPKAARSARSPSTWLIWYFFLCLVSHGILDGFTDGGLGVAHLAPFSNARFFFPFRPIAVAPISITGFFTQRGMWVFASELAWVWVPAAALAFLGVRLHTAHRRAEL